MLIPIKGDKDAEKNNVNQSGKVNNGSEDKHRGWEVFGGYIFIPLIVAFVGYVQFCIQNTQNRHTILKEYAPKPKRADRCAAVNPVTPLMFIPS